MSRTASPSSGKPYGVATVCRIWRVARATVYRHRTPARPAPPRRPGPAEPIVDADLVEEIRQVLQRSPFHGEGHRKVWVNARDALANRWQASFQPVAVMRRPSSGTQ